MWRPDDTYTFPLSSEPRRHVVSSDRTPDDALTDSGALTYERYFGLTEKPFSLSPDPRFFFSNSSHGSTFAALLAGIRRREGLLALTGEVGTGKTTLCRAVLQSLDRNTVAAFVPDPFLSREDLLKILLVEFGVVSIDDVRSGRLRGASRTDLCYPLYEFLTSLQPLQSFAVMMIDEAQNLSSQLLEEIRILSDLENRQKLLHVVLVGQPELQMRLDAPEMRQLSQRLSVRCELLPLERRDIGPYISHRLAIAGNSGAVEFTQPTIEVVWRASRGIPRVINLVCDRALFSAASAGRKTVDLEDVQHYLERPGTLAGRERRHDQSRPDAQHTRSPLPMQPVLFGGLLGHAAPSTLPETPAEVAYEEDAASTPQRRGRLLALVTTLVVATAVIGYWSWAPKASPPRLSGLTQPSQSPSARPVPPKDSLGPSTGREAGFMTAARRDSGDVVFPKPDVPLSQTSAARFLIQMATFQSAARAAEAAQQFTNAGYHAYNSEVSLRDGGSVSAVFLGPYAEIDLAERDLQRAQQVSGYRGGLIVHVGSSALLSQPKPELSAAVLKTPEAPAAVPKTPEVAASALKTPESSAPVQKTPESSAAAASVQKTPELSASPPIAKELTPPAPSLTPPESAAAPADRLVVRENLPAGAPAVPQSNASTSALSLSTEATPIKSAVKSSQAQALPAKFAIQVGTFRNAARATQALQEFHDAGYHAYSAEVAQRDGGSALAVFLGPYAELPPAEKDLERAQQIPGYSDGHIVQFGVSTLPSKPAR